MQVVNDFTIWNKLSAFKYI